MLLPQGKLSEGRRSWKRSHSLFFGNIMTRSPKMSGKPFNSQHLVGSNNIFRSATMPPGLLAFFKHELRIRRELLLIIRQSIKTRAIPDSLALQPFVYTELQCRIYKRRDYCKFCDQGHCRGRGDHFCYKTDFQCSTRGDRHQVLLFMRRAQVQVPSLKVAVDLFVCGPNKSNFMLASVQGGSITEFDDSPYLLHLQSTGSILERRSKVREKGGLVSEFRTL